MQTWHVLVLHILLPGSVIPPLLPALHIIHNSPDFCPKTTALRLLPGLLLWATHKILAAERLIGQDGGR